MLSTFPSDLFFSVLAFVLSAALLWVGHTHHSQVHRAANKDLVALRWINTLLIGTGLWWPAYLGHAAAAPVSGLPVLCLVSVVGLVCGWVSQHGVDQPPMASGHVAGAVGTLALAIVLLSASLALPGVSTSWGMGAPLFFAVSLTVGLRLLHLPWKNAVHSRAARACGAVVAAASMVALTHRTPTVAVAHVLDPVAWPTLMILGIGIWTSQALRHLRHLPPAGIAPGIDPMIDPLTGLGSLKATQQALSALVIERQDSLKPFALMLVDLDGFKQLNATLGHAVGDEVIKHVGKRLQAQAGSQAMVCRTNADEYVLLVKNKITAENALSLARRVVDHVARPMELTSRKMSLTCCVGVALFPAHGNADDLLARADAALRDAKRNGVGRVCIFNDSLEDRSSEGLQLLADLRRALDGNELQLYYQPKIDVASGQVVAVEALLRWKHPTRGNIPPATFVTLAERFGLVATLGDWVIENACRQSRLWSDQGLNMRVAINISAQHMHQSDLGHRIASALERYRLDPTRLTCEITETLAMENTQTMQENFEQLGRLGVHLSIDDFGTGYSSLAYLHKLPAREVKIDSSLVLDLEYSSSARAVVDAVIKLAHALDKRVVAEGVENIHQRRVLTELGCDELQGFLFARPMPADDLLQWALADLRLDKPEFRRSLYIQPRPTLQEEIDALRKPPVIH